MLATRGDVQAAIASGRGLGSATWRALGTSVQLVVTDADALPAARRVLTELLDRVDLAASRFRADSELVQLTSGEPTEVSPLLAQLLQAALDAAAWTGGLVDPTLGRSMMDLGYDRTFRLVPADGPALTLAVRPADGWQTVRLDGRTATVPRGTVLDLGATAKGLAADLGALAVAEVAGGALVSLGGDVAVAGDVPAAGWPVLLADTADPEAPAAEGQVVTLREGGLATSGTAARRWRRGGSLVHHLLDPRTGVPAAGPWRTVSVVAETCVLANTASTAAVVLGVDAPGWLRDRGLSARLVDASGTPTLVRWEQR